MRRILVLLAAVLCFAVTASAQITDPYARRYRRLAADPFACDSNRQGYVYFNTVSNVVKTCDGTNWTSQGASQTGLTLLSFGSDPADAGVIRLENNTSIKWEANPTGTDCGISVNTSNQFSLDCPIASSSSSAFAFDSGTYGYAFQMVNKSATGTTVNKLAKDSADAPMTALITATTDVDANKILGVVVAGAGTTGSATIVRWGYASCVFDGATTAGQLVYNSGTVAGDCSVTSNGDPIGFIPSTNGAGGTYSMFVDVGLREPRSFGFVLGADNGSALVTGDDQASIFVNRTGRSVYITEVWIECDATDASTSLNLQRNDGSAANILSSDVTCNTTGQTGTLASAERTLANGDRVDLLTVTASTAKRATIWVTYR